jgi:hypothetical protein
MFELTNAATQGRLSNQQNFCSPAKATFICRDDRVTQMYKIDSRYSALVALVAEFPFVGHSEHSLWPLPIHGRDKAGFGFAVSARKRV